MHVYHQIDVFWSWVVMHFIAKISICYFYRAGFYGTATFHLLLQGDLVLKLNPSPEEYRISSIVSSRLNIYRHLSTNRNLDNTCNIRCQPYNWTSITNIFSLCLLNTRTIGNKIAEFTDFVCDCKTDFLAITERWLVANDCAILSQVCLSARTLIIWNSLILPSVTRLTTSTLDYQLKKPIVKDPLFRVLLMKLRLSTSTKDRCEELALDNIVTWLFGL